jgi:hypothetical protein
MKKNILISLFAVLGLCGMSFAQEDYQGQLSDKKLQSMGIFSSGSIEKGSLETSKENSVYDYDKEYEDLLKSIHTSDNTAYELDSTLLDADLTHYEDDYDELLNRASKILGDERVAMLSNRVEGIIFEKDGKKGAIEISSSMDQIADNTTKKIQNIHLKNTNEIIQESFSLNNSDKNLNLYAKSYAVNDDTDNLYQNLLAGLSDGSGDEITQLFNLASEEGLEGEAFQYQLDDGYPMEEVTTVGLFSGRKKHFKKCLIMKTYGGGTWRTYCQPIAKPTQCTDQQWRDLSTMPIMFC